MNRPKSPRSKLIRQIDAIHSRIILSRDGHRCVICRSDRNVECGHIFSRRHMATRWDTHPSGNCHAQCHTCNMTHVTNPAPFVSWFTSTYGHAAYEELHRRANSTTHLTTSDLLATLRRLQNYRP